MSSGLPITLSGYVTQGSGNWSGIFFVGQKPFPMGLSLNSGPPNARDGSILIALKGDASEIRIDEFLGAIHSLSPVNRSDFFAPSTEIDVNNS